MRQLQTTVSPLHSSISLCMTVCHRRTAVYGIGQNDVSEWCASGPRAVSGAGAIGTDNDDAEPIVRGLGECFTPLPFSNVDRGAGTAVCLDEGGHVELSQVRHVGGGGRAKSK